MDGSFSADMTERAIVGPVALTPPRSVATPAALTLAPGAKAKENRRAAQAVRRPGSFRKRAFDLTLASLVLAAASPALILVWIAIRAGSPGPGLFWSERVGRHGRHFMMPKFRTMTIGAPVVSRESITNAGAHITVLGRVLRRWSIDELPQLWCIVRGDMSFIGPRPLLPDDPAEQARQLYPAVRQVRPGLSGLSQVRGRNFVTPRRKARLDAAYARVRNGALDLEICARTVVTLISGRGHL